MRKRFLVILIALAIIADLIFIAGIYISYSNNDFKEIGKYFRVQKYEDRIERMYPGKVDVYCIDANEIILRISPEITLDECFSIALKFQNWRIRDNALCDFAVLTLVPDEALTDNPRHSIGRSVAQFSYGDNNDIVYIGISLGGYKYFEGSKISSFGVFDDAFGIGTGVFIELDDMSVLSKITKWQCRAGLYADEQLDEIEARDIPVIVWGMEDGS